MMLFIHHIRSVAKYESKLLLRSWFFKIFTVLAFLFLGFFNFIVLLSDDGPSMWMPQAISSNIPYMNLLFLNTGEAVIAIFLASDFLKRDKKLDTSEVFYVRPLSNAEYVAGKIWGNLRVFLILNVLILGLTLVFNLMAPGTSVDWAAYPVYLVIISIPTLLFITGLSVFLMLIFKNQALTFIVLLGYIGATLFYISDKFYFVFDYMTYNLPLVKSSIVGFTNEALLLNHRAIYFFAGLGFIAFTVFLFNRLPNSPRSRYPWLFLSVCLLSASLFSGYKHVRTIQKEGEMRAMYTAVNNRYVHTPKMVVDRYDIALEQYSESISSVATLSGTALQSASRFTFCLNPGLRVEEVRSGEKVLEFNREGQIIEVAFGREIPEGDSLSLTIRYQGTVDPAFCYLDIPAETLQKASRHEFFNMDKQYSFQTADYLLFTPETWWYPRPGTSYSDESPDWQQTYFSQFHLRIKPLPGLIPLSQGEGKEEGDGVYAFSPDHLLQSASLAIGRYRQKQLEADSTLYSIWYIDGHDYFSSPFDSIMDTIPTFIHNTRESLERTYSLSYPFSRFSVIETPVQFASYPRAWSLAQEVVQPEIVFFPEKGCLFYAFNIERRKKGHKRWSKWNGPEINDEEAMMRTLNDMLGTFVRTEGDRDFSSGSRGSYQITTQSNPFFLFPQLYNFRYNIFSSEWPVANRLIELYLQNKSDNTGWERETNGISNNEKANLLIEKKDFKSLLSGVEYSDLLSHIISLKAQWLFAEAEVNMGVNAFRKTLYSVLDRYTFRNIRFETLLDTLGAISQTDIRSGIAQWETPTPLPFYSIGEPDITSITYRGQETFVMKLMIGNHSDHDGFIQLNIRGGGVQNPENDPRMNRKLALAAHQTKRLVTVWDEAPRNIIVNTLISGNLPAIIDNNSARNIKRERRANIDEEGDFTVPETALDIPGEVIVDNEDSLFSLSEPVNIGLLPKWLDRVETGNFKYAGIWFWRPPFQWTATTDPQCYGKYIRSVYVIKSGDGSQTATWKVPVPSEGDYEVHYHLFNQELKYNNRLEGEYRFKIIHDDETEEAYVDLRRSRNGWQQLGVYYFASDTVQIVLSNESKVRTVAADAVKIIRR